MINQTDYFFLSQFIFKYFLQWKQGESSKPKDPSKRCLKDQVLLQLWVSMFTLVVLALFTRNVNLLCLSYKFTLLWVYHNSYCLRLLPWKWGNVSNNVRETVITSEFSFFQLSSLYDSHFILTIYWLYSCFIILTFFFFCTHTFSLFYFYPILMINDYFLLCVLRVKLPMSAL